jgi:8-oxo-dGTP pyrophosphatase MutT (NUDIX family)
MDKRHYLFEKNKRSKRNKFSCANCGKDGHIYRNCEDPITSFGILAVRKKTNHVKTGCIKEINRYRCPLHSLDSSKESEDETHGVSEILYLMIQRKDTMGYIDLIRGKYPEDPISKKKILKIYLEEMTCDERRRILYESFEELWDKIWLNRNYKFYLTDFKEAKIKFLKLDLLELVNNTTCNFYEPEFTFPKGRKNMNEDNISCAIREFSEETGYKESHITIISNEEIEETFIGTNGLPYKHVYYLAKMNSTAPLFPSINEKEIQQIGEVSNCGWFTYQQCMKLIRSYDVEKKNMLMYVHEKVKKKYFTGL